MTEAYQYLVDRDMSVVPELPRYSIHTVQYTVLHLLFCSLFAIAINLLPAILLDVVHASIKARRSRAVQKTNLSRLKLLLVYAAFLAFET
jgi:hypothetical protein